MINKGSGLSLNLVSPMISKPTKYLYGLLLCFLLLPCGCEKETTYKGETHSGSKVIILGHAGMGIYFNMPQNSFESISTAISIGCDGSEMDVQLTKDSVLVAFHDGYLDGKTDCEGLISEMNWEEIKVCKYDHATKQVFLVKVEELFEKLPALNDLYFSFDCKFHVPGASKDAYEWRFARAIQRLFDRYKIGGNVFLEGHEGFLDKVKSLGVNTQLFLFSNNDDNPIEKAKNNYAGISTVMDISSKDIQRAYENNLYIMVWDPDNYSQNKSTLDRKPDIIQTDDPISILKLLNRYNYENVTP